MRKNLQGGAVAAVLLGASVATAAQASQSGRFQIKVMASHSAIDGAIKRVNRDPLGLSALADTRAGDACVPTLAAEYFLLPRVSLETICCLTQHDVRGSGALQGAALIDAAEVIPATVTLKHHFPLEGGVKPSVGAGPAYFMVFGESVCATSARAFGASKVGLSSALGAVLQAGVDIPLRDETVGLSLDMKRYFVETRGRFQRGSQSILETEHKLDPWVASAGVTWRV